MAKQNLNAPVIQHIKNIVYDQDGHAALILGMDIYTITLPDNSIITYKTSQNIQLCDGHVWNGAQGAAGLFLGCCNYCRHPRISIFGFKKEKPSHGLCLVKNLKKCFSCGLTTCSKHHSLGMEGHWRCLSCPGALS